MLEKGEDEKGGGGGEFTVGKKVERKERSSNGVTKWRGGGEWGGGFAEG